MSQFFFLPGGQFVQKDTVKDGTKGFTEINKKKLHHPLSCHVDDLIMEGDQTTNPS